MQSTKNQLGARIREIRRAHGLTQEQLAVLVDIEQKHVSCIERGKNAPTIDRLQKISEVLNVPVKDFFDFGNKSKEEVRLRSIDKMVQELDEDKRKIAYKIFSDIIRSLQEI